MSTAEMEYEARADSRWRAKSPGVRICKIDNVETIEEPEHGHDFEECMAWRHDNVIADDEPWHFWLPYDEWLKLYQPPPPPSPPPPLTDWQIRARVNPHGIQFMNGWGSGWDGYTFCTVLGPSRFMLPAGLQVRVTMQGIFTLANLYIGPVSAKPFVATALTRMTFNGGSNTGQTGPRPDGNLVTDPLALAIDARNGVMISGYITGPSPLWTPLESVAWVRTRNPESDWFSRWRYGDYASALDKSKMDTDTSGTHGWVGSTVSDLAVLQVEDFYG